IIGGGSVGLSLSMELGSRNVNNILVNERHTTSTHPKGSTLNSRTMEHLRRLGLADRVRKSGLPLDYPTDSVYVTRLSGYELGRLPMPTLREKISNPGPWGETLLTPEPIHRSNQFYFEEIMYTHAQTFDSSNILFGWKLLSFKENSDGVRAEIQNVDTMEIEYVICNYLVGCDGGNSLVRKQLGFSYQGRSSSGDKFYDGKMLSIYIKAPNIFDIINMPLAWHYWTINPQGRVDFITLDGKGEFVLLAEISGADDVNKKRVEMIVKNAIGAETHFEVISVQEWVAGLALVVDHYQKGRVFLAGDAVHLFTPSGGFGFNTGIDDAANLGWKLAGVIQGWASVDLLETYETERLPIGLRNTSASGDYANKIGSLSFPKYIDEDSKRGDIARNNLKEELMSFKEEFASMGVVLGARYDTSPIIISDKTTPPPDDRANYVPSACPGGRAPHYWIKEKYSLYDQLEEGFNLIYFIKTDQEILSKFDATCRKLGIPFSLVEIREKGIRDLYGANYAIIRPDHHVAWRGNKIPANPGHVMKLLTGHNIN
ncbi:MAG: FAD-dependent monooxygenase, partial [Pseudomonadota bacterium]|nr:FAD-dependent monooxygenase [Pseudomonadota bacterium]